MGAGDAEAEATRKLESLRSFMQYPFDCIDLVNAQKECMARTSDWRQCTSTQDAADSCIASGERRRFGALVPCRRWRRLYQSCVASHLSDPATQCSELLDRLSDCLHVHGAVTPEASTEPAAS